MTDMDRTTPSKLLDYLPDIYRDQEHTFLSRYLSAFEKILIGRGDDVKIPSEAEGASSKSLEETIADIATLFDPSFTPKDFLPWLASWAALSLRADLDEGHQRKFIANIIRLYRRRGTKDNLIELLQIFTGTTPEIDEDAMPGADFRKRYSYSNPPRSKPPHFFKVAILLADPDEKTVERQRAIARALIDLEKPSHTFYELEIKFASMRIGNFTDRNKPKLKLRADLGVNTLINTWENIPDELKKD